MNEREQVILNDLVNAIENLSVSVDAIEAVLIRRGLLQTGEIGLQSPLHVQTVAAKLAATRNAIAALGWG
jgi:hypothetical protein